jgi:hypothetical protein
VQHLVQIGCRSIFLRVRAFESWLFLPQGLQKFHGIRHQIFQIGGGDITKTPMQFCA